MIKIKTAKIAGLILLISMAVYIHADIGTFSMDILKVPSGLRSQAMGGAYTALSDDLEAIDVNPAGLAFIDGNDLLFIQDLYVQGLIYDSLYFAHGMGDAGTFGASLKYLNGGTIQQTNETGGGLYAGEGPSISSMGFMAAAAYGFNVGKMSYNDFTKNLYAGADLKVSGEMIGNFYSDFAVSLDLGAVYTIVISEADFMSNRGEFVWNKAGIGFDIKNAGTSFSAGLTPLSFAVGAYTQMLNLGVSNDRIRLALDLEYNMDNGMNVKTGLEYLQMLGDYNAVLRAGYDMNPADRQASGLSFGGGVGMKLGAIQANIDYVFLPYGELGAGQKIGLYLKF